MVSMFPLKWQLLEKRLSFRRTKGFSRPHPYGKVWRRKIQESSISHAHLKDPEINVVHGNKQKKPT